MSLDVHDNIIFKYSRRNQTFHLVVWDYPVVWDHLPIAIHGAINQKVQDLSDLVKNFQKFGTELIKNVMRENGFPFQHCHFLHDKFLVNNESLQIQKH